MAMQQTVVVTGASGGVGRAIAEAFAGGGANVVLIARGRAGLEAAAEAVRAKGARAMTIVADVSDFEQVANAAGEVEATLGPIDVWVNNAMATVFAPVEKLSAPEIRRATEVTYLGAVWGTQAALQRMRPRDRGVIVQIGSALAYRAIPLQAPYCGAKHALRGFTDALRCELRHERSAVRVTMVHLCSFNTPQFSWGRSHMPRHPQPMAPIFQPEAAAAAVLRAARGRRREIWVGYPTAQAIFGNQLLPWLADRILARQAYGGQQTDPATPHGRSGNLFKPLDDERTYGIRGPFDARTKTTSLQLITLSDMGWRILVAAPVGLVAVGLLWLALI